MATDDRIKEHHACFHGLLEKVEQLHAEGIRLNVRCSVGHTPLSSAAMRGKTRVLKYLIENGADVNEQDAQGHFALYFAVLAVAAAVAQQVGAYLRTADEIEGMRTPGPRQAKRRWRRRHRHWASCAPIQKGRTCGARAAVATPRAARRSRP